MNRKKRSELTHRSELTQKVKNTTRANNYFNHRHESEADDEASSIMPVSTLSVPLYHHHPPDTPISTMEPPAVGTPPPPPPLEEERAIEYEHPREEEEEPQSSELPKNSNSKRAVLEKSILGLKSFTSMTGSSAMTLLQSSGSGGNNGIISPSNRMKAMLGVGGISSSRKGDGNNDIIPPPPPPPPPPPDAITPSSPTSANDILRDLSNVVSGDDGGGGPRPPHSGNSLENYVLPPILRMDIMDTTTNYQGGMEVIKVSKVCKIYIMSHVYIYIYIFISMFSSTQPIHTCIMVYTYNIVIYIFRMGNNNHVNSLLLRIIVPCTLPVINHRDAL